MDISTLQRRLTRQENEELTALQRSLHEKFRRTTSATYMGTKFMLRSGVFPPRPDSMTLVQKMRIKEGSRVLDVCCGSGVIGHFALDWYKASYVLGLDRNPDAVQCAIENAERLRLKKYEARVSNVLSALTPEERFDVVTFNPPYRDLVASNFVEATTWDHQMEVHQEFFMGIGKYLAPGGRVFFAQANFGNLEKVQRILETFGWEATLLGERPLDENPIYKFYAFEAKRIMG